MLHPAHPPHLPDCTRSLPELAATDSNAHRLADLQIHACALLQARNAPGEALCEILPGAWLARAYSARLPAAALYRPALGAVLQSAKRVLVGDTVLDYRAGEGLLTHLPVPARGVVTAARRNAPFLGLVVELKPALLRQLLSDMGDAATMVESAPAPFSLVALDSSVLACLQRLLGLAGDSTSAQDILWPSLQRELFFRMLQGTAGPVLMAMAQPPPLARRMATAIRSVQHGFREPLDTAALARSAGMSATLFYRSFREATGLSPLQYQKQLRLLEARRLLERGGISISSAAFTVGYESPSQFSREFSRSFGHPPKRSLPSATR